MCGFCLNAPTFINYCSQAILCAAVSSTERTGQRRRQGHHIELQSIENRVNNLQYIYMQAKSTMLLLFLFFSTHAHKHIHTLPCAPLLFVFFSSSSFVFMCVCTLLTRLLNKKTKKNQKTQKNRCKMRNVENPRGKISKFSQLISLRERLNATRCLLALR